MSKEDKQTQENATNGGVPYADLLANMQQTHAIQGYDGNWNHDPYMHGMYNGMELMLSMAEGRSPKYKEAPKTWAKDEATNCQPVCSTDG